MFTEQVVNILKVGLSGLAFLLMALTYYLLTIEQKKVSPNESILKSIRQYGMLSLIFVLIVGGFSVAELFIKSPKQGNTVVCKEAIERLKVLSQSPEQNADQLRALIESQLQACE